MATTPRAWRLLRSRTRQNIQDARSRLASWPEVDGIVRRWLDALPPRARRCVELAYGQRLRIYEVAATLGVSERTVFYDLAHARPILGQLIDPARPCDEGIHNLICGIIEQAWLDATRGGGRDAREARAWLESRFAQELLLTVGIDPDALVSRLRRGLRARLGR